ncbi:MAG TPA: hypothetical protein VH969_23175 [Actinophytocola sp.]|jgi:hypothetical protein|uniref:hypothetical protein n=1 Tax=Actinophytocola sp. TaxID=1872138 RepID=UPI002F927FF2
MAQLPDRTEQGGGTADTAPHPVEEHASLVVWQNTTMLDSDPVDGVAEDNILRGID